MTVPRHAPDARRVDVTVLTPVLNEARALASVIEAMRAQQFDGPIEFLFIDGGSDDATREIIERAARGDPRVRLLHNPARRTPHALNVGLRAARGEFVARMDAHTLYPVTYLATGVRRLAQGDAAWASGPQLAHGRGRWSRRVALALRSPLGVGSAAYRAEGERETEVDSGFTGVWRKETLDRLGGWSEDWLVNEDGELAARFRRQGGRIVCVPAMAARYAPRDSLHALARQYWRYGRYRAKTCGAYPESMRRSHVLPPALVVLLALAACPFPAPGRRTARRGAAGYLAGLVAEALRMRRRGDSGAWALPLVWATMHVAWGGGFLAGSCRFGPPWRALLRLATAGAGGRHVKVPRARPIRRQ